ncbi:hypothetical protein [Burkholderia cepacia]|uniref:hypothetical protein n=1 Tax=Burkholderia cepacia TaxID=292 RepID=UPI0021486799|nr:hypothetical protein [Burkholderia cepacia]
MTYLRNIGDERARRMADRGCRHPVQRCEAGGVDRQFLELREEARSLPQWAVLQERLDKWKMSNDSACIRTSDREQARLPMDTLSSARIPKPA